MTPVVPARPRRPIGLIILVSVLAVLLVGTLGLAGAVRFLGPGPKTVAVTTGWPGGETRRAAQAARDCVSHFFDIDRDTVDQDIRRVLACSTGTFHQEYSAGATELKDAVLENRVRANPKILAAGVVTADLNSATVLVAADARVKNTKSPDGRTVHYRVQVEMSLVDDTWKIAELTFVG